MPKALLSSYVPTPSRFDEMLDASGAPRGHWRELLGRLASVSPEAAQALDRLVHEAIASDGVTYNVYADPKGISRPWELDLLPLVLPPDECRAISAAVAQRARLLDAVLRDVYGAQTLLAEGLLPPALVYAADLARAPDGQWWVLGDRTRGPSGAGYALQNRMTLRRAFPDEFRALHVEPLAPFFGALSDSLVRLAPVKLGETPLVVLLTPGPYNETYFEHSFLARMLGLSLVEGQDLLVRGDNVFMKTLRGLRRVHVILRRLDDDFCDPVELRADSALGVPGLLHAVRAGNVVVANALGSALLETGALTGFYPAVSDRLFGEKLLMPSIATWWCGEAPALDYVLAHLDELVIKPAYPSMTMEPVFGHALGRVAREDLVLRLKAQPHAYVAQEWMRLSHSPVWSRDTQRLLPRATTLRVFAVATREGYVVMPGALTRVAPQDGDDVVSMQWGGSSKDTWMLADQPLARPLPGRRRVGVADIQGSVVEIASRVGENLFWMGRYAERCEALARILRAALVRVAEASEEAVPEIESLAAALVRLEVFADSDEVDFVAAVGDPSVQGGVAANVLRLHSCAHQVRERMSTDNWHVFHRLRQRLKGPEASEPSGRTLPEALEALDEVMLACVSLAGFAMDDMTRDESWRFLLLGRRLERLSHLSVVIAHVLADPAPRRADALEWLLEAANSIVTFRARYRRAPELLPVLHLVMLDETNPHSVAFQLGELQAVLAHVAAELDVGHRRPELTLQLERLRSALREAPLDDLELESGDRLEAGCGRFVALLERCAQIASALSDEIHRRFFTHAATPAPVGVEPR